MFERKKLFDSTSIYPSVQDRYPAPDQSPSRNYENEKEEEKMKLKGEGKGFVQNRSSIMCLYSPSIKVKQ
jgi:hypothetical protein